MKHTHILSIIGLASLFFSGCSTDDLEKVSSDRGPAVESVSLSLSEIVTGVETRAAGVNGYSVNTSLDPTASDKLTDRNGWKLDISIYKSDTEVYQPDGQAIGSTYNGGEMLTPNLYFPNYKKQHVDLLLYHEDKASGKDIIENNQSGDGDLLKQDVLYRLKSEKTNPVHKLTDLQVWHKHSLLDFVLDNVTLDEIKDGKVTVQLGTEEYTPYQVARSDGKLEYLLIVPEGTNVNPSIKFTTHTQEIEYTQTIKILETGTTTYGSNKCYCFTLKGLELKISPITIINWASGESIPGEYIAVTSYITYRGDKNTEYTLTFENKLTQTFTTNNDGECTIKQIGRELTSIKKGSGGTVIGCKVDLREMMLNLEDMLNVAYVGKTANVYYDNNSSPISISAGTPVRASNRKITKINNTECNIPELGNMTIDLDAMQKVTFNSLNGGLSYTVTYDNGQTQVMSAGVGKIPTGVNLSGINGTTWNFPAGGIKALGGETINVMSFKATASTTYKLLFEDAQEQTVTATQADCAIVPLGALIIKINDISIPAQEITKNLNLDELLKTYTPATTSFTGTPNRTYILTYDVSGKSQKVIMDRDGKADNRRMHGSKIIKVNQTDCDLTVTEGGATDLAQYEQVTFTGSEGTYHLVYNNGTKQSITIGPGESSKLIIPYGNTITTINGIPVSTPITLQGGESYSLV